MKRFVEHFRSFDDEYPVEEKINDYAERNNSTIITISADHRSSVYVLFEKEGED